MSYRNDDYVELAQRAQRGDRESLRLLAEAVRPDLHEYVFRLTLREDLTQDIVQETILEMLQIFQKLRRSEKFRSWLHGIAFNKVRNHYGKRWRQRTRSFTEVGYEPQGSVGGDVVAEAVTAELKQVVVECIAELEPRHRAVLSMRCYDQMSYAHIAERMNCSEIAVRALFCRAKKALARRLSAHGLGQGSLLLALAVFGKMTAASEAAAAEVSVTAATLKAGPVAAIVALLTGKTAVITTVTAGALVAGSVAVNVGRVASVSTSGSSQTTNLPAAWWETYSATAEQECWHYFPQGPDGPLMMRLLHYESAGGPPCCRILQNQHANYHADGRAQRVHINNYRVWKPDLSVRRLPTDSAALSDFIAQVEGRPSNMERTARRGTGLLIVCKRHGRAESRIWQIERHTNALSEEYFQNSWPQSTNAVDRRDAMHKRGWTYFRIAGELNGRSVCGSGCVPFVYAASGSHYPWLKLGIGTRLRLVDTPDGAHIRRDHDRIEVRYRGGSFFKGLGRPWLGLHCIDTIRRDAAAERLPFETTYDADSDRATITVHTESVDLVYTVDMLTDILEKIAFLRSGGQGAPQTGELHFDYLQDIDEAEDRFAAPPSSISATAANQDPGILWLSALLEAP